MTELTEILNFFILMLEAVYLTTSACLRHRDLRHLALTKSESTYSLLSCRSLINTIDFVDYVSNILRFMIINHHIWLLLGTSDSSTSKLSQNFHDFLIDGQSIISGLQLILTAARTHTTFIASHFSLI